MPFDPLKKGKAADVAADRRSCTGTAGGYGWTVLLDADELLPNTGKRTFTVTCTGTGYACVGTVVPSYGYLDWLPGKQAESVGLFSYGGIFANCSFQDEGEFGKNDKVRCEAHTDTPGDISLVFFVNGKEAGRATAKAGSRFAVGPNNRPPISRRGKSSDRVD